MDPTSTAAQPGDHVVAILDRNATVWETAADGRRIGRTPVVQVTWAHAQALGRTVPVHDPVDGVVYLTPAEAAVEAEQMATFATCMGPSAGPTAAGQQAVAQRYRAVARDLHARHALQRRGGPPPVAIRCGTRPRGAGRPRARGRSTRSSARSGDSGSGKSGSSSSADGEPPGSPPPPSWPGFRPASASRQPRRDWLDWIGRRVAELERAFAPSWRLA